MILPRKYENMKQNLFTTEYTEHTGKKNNFSVNSVFSVVIFLLIGGIFVSLSAYTQQSQLDINNATFNQIAELPIPQNVAEEIYEYLLLYDEFNSIYDLRKIKGISSEKFEEIKPLIRIGRKEGKGETYLNIYRIQKSLATEESPTKAAIEDWQDMLLSPMNVNKVTIDDLILLENVTLIDAIAVIKHLKIGQQIKEYRDLRDINGLSNYGFRNIRNYVAYTDPKSIKFSGNYRLNFDYGYDYETDNAPETQMASITQAYEDLNEKTKYYDAGFNDRDIDWYYDRLNKEYDYLASLKHRTILSQRIRTRIGNNFIGGIRWQKDFNSSVFTNDWRGYLQTSNIGPVKKLFLGDYRVALGQGLLLDNSSELISRTYTRSQGIYGDLTENSLLGFRGVGGEADFNLKLPVKTTLFYSKTLRDGIENPDGTIFYYVISTPRLPTNYHTFAETNLGASVRLDLSDIGLIPEGTALVFNTLNCKYNKDFSTLVKWIDIPNDATYFTDYNYLKTTKGNKRNFNSIDFRTAVENISMEGEYAWQQNGGIAYLLKARAQYEYLYVMTLYRHFDVNYDNPYNRGFNEQVKFEDTEFEKPYRLIDPTFSQLQYFPSPKAEKGLYTEIRYQISRQITLTRAYLDVWQNIAHGLTNYRFQGEIEYRPVFPLRFRLKQKIQRKHLPKDVQASVSNTYETSFRILASLTERNFLSCELRRGVVGLTSNLEYNNEKAIWGDFLSVAWEHNFSDAIGLEAGLSVWKCDGLSQWIFEDVGIDFLDAQGLKYYFVMTQRPANFLLLRLKFKGKYTEIPHTGVLQAENLHFADGSLINTKEFITHNDVYNIGLQLDFLW